MIGTGFGPTNTDSMRETLDMLSFVYLLHLERNGQDNEVYHQKGAKLFDKDIFANSATGPFSFDIPAINLTDSSGEAIKDVKFFAYYDEQLDLCIRIQSEDKFPPKIALNKRNLDFSFEERAFGTFHCLPLKTTIASNNRTQIDMLPSRQPIVLDKNVAVSALTGVISNGPHFLIFTNAKRDGDGQQPIILSADDWRISVYEYSHTKTSFDRMRSFAGRKVVTHWFSITRNDGRSFFGNDTIETVFSFLDFMSFVRGARVGLLHIANSTHLDSLVYARLGSNRHDSFGAPNNWFDVHLTNVANEIFQGFYNEGKKPKKNLTVRRALEYYCLGNITQRNSTESALIMTQASLEALSYSILGKQKFDKVKSSSGIQGVIRGAASALGIVTDPAAGLKALEARIAVENWRDGYQAITEFRNGVTHSKTISYSGRELVDAWRAAQWLTEIMLLIWLGYRGEFSDRRTKKWVGEKVHISEYLQN